MGKEQADRGGTGREGSGQLVACASTRPTPTRRRALSPSLCPLAPYSTPSCRFEAESAEGRILFRGTFATQRPGGTAQNALDVYVKVIRERGGEGKGGGKKGKGGGKKGKGGGKKGKGGGKKGKGRRVPAGRRICATPCALSYCGAMSHIPPPAPLTHGTPG